MYRICVLCTCVFHSRVHYTYYMKENQPKFTHQLKPSWEFNRFSTVNVHHGLIIKRYYFLSL